MARTTRRAVGRIHRLPGGLPGSPGKSGSRHVSLGDLVSAPDSGASKAASTIIIAAVESGWDAGSVGLQKASVLSTGAVLFGAVVDIRRSRRSRRRACGGTTAALPGRRVVLTAAAGAVEPVASCRRSAPSGTRTGLCLRARQKKQLRVGSWAGSAQGPFPSALPGSATVFGCFCHRPDAPTCHAQRGHPANLAAESVASARPDRCQKAAARGHGALARLRALSRGLCLARSL
jgi:hypothetical protein